MMKKLYVPGLISYQPATDSSTTDRSATDHSATDRSTTDPLTTDRSTTDRTATDHSATDRSTIDPSTTDCSPTDHSATDHSATDRSTTDPSTTDPSTTGRSATDRSTVYYSTTAHSRAGLMAMFLSTGFRISTFRSAIFRHATSAIPKLLFRMIPVTFLIAVAGLSIKAQPLTEHQVDSIVASAMELTPQAGIAVAVVQDGEVVFQKGYGVRSIETQEPVDENTLFAIASNSKAFTGAALAMLVDEGKLKWDDRVIDHIPEFRMYDPYVTANFTIVDLLTHRSGLGLGAGDLMIFPDGSDFTIDDVVRSFQYQEQVSDFRTKYDYDNLLYIVAGEVVARTSGMSWEEFVEARIMQPLGMKQSAASYSRISNRSNIATPHSTETGEIKTVSFYDLDLTNAAGGIWACVSDLAKWMLVQLNEGKFGPDLEKILFSEEAQKEMWYPHTVIRYNARGDERYGSHLNAYGLGWVLGDMNGYTVVSHTGGLAGMLSKTALVPELNAGVVVLTNTLPGGLNYFTLAQNILDGFTGAEPMDWNGFAKSRIESGKGEADSVLNAVWATTELAKQEERDLSKYTGMYEDDWFGKMEIWLEEDQGEELLMIRSLRSPKLNGEMLYYKATTFAIQWDYTDMECSAFATFSLDPEGIPVGITMEGISPNIDFSFDFHDLDLKRVDDPVGKPEHPGEGH